VLSSGAYLGIYAESLQYRHSFVNSFGWYENDSSVFIAMEYVELGDLENILVAPLPELEAREIIRQVLRSLEYMHENRFAHRDLKPSVCLPCTRRFYFS
jgi:serine/threonine protein kinase